MIFDELRASNIPAMFGIYWRSSIRSMTRFTVSSEIFFVFPWITLETVAVLTPNSSAMSQIRTLCSSIGIISPILSIS